MLILGQISGRRIFLPVIVNRTLRSVCTYTPLSEIQEKKTSMRLFPVLTHRNLEGSDIRRFSLVTFSLKVQEAVAVALCVLCVIGFLMDLFARIIVSVRSLGKTRKM